MVRRERGWTKKMRGRENEGRRKGGGHMRRGEKGRG